MQFVTELRGLVAREYAWEEEAMKNDLKQFLWDDGTCEKGLEVVWRDLGRE